MKRISFNIILTLSVAYLLVGPTLPVHAGSSEASSEASSQAGSQASSESGGGNLLTPPAGTVHYSPSGVYVSPPKRTPVVVFDKVNHKVTHKGHRTVRRRGH